MKRLILVALVTLLGRTALAAPSLDEWTLPNPASKPLEIDAAHGPIYYVDGNDHSLNQVDPIASKLISYTSPLFAYSPPGGIRVAQDAALGDVVFATYLIKNRIVRLAPAGSAPTMSWWQFSAPIFRGPRALDVDRATGHVWFATYDGINQPVIARLVPSTKVVTYWVLPAAIANAASQIQGIVFFPVPGSPGKVYFSLANQQAVAILDLATNRVTRWPWRSVGAGQIAVNANGEVFAPQGSGAGAALRLRPSTNTFTEWVTGASSFTPYITIDSAAFPYLTGSLGGVPNVSRLVPGVAGIDVVVGPTTVFVAPATQLSISDMGSATRTTAPLPHVVVPMGSVAAGAFTRFSATSATGAVSAESPTRVWTTETAAHKVARLNH